MDRGTGCTWGNETTKTARNRVFRGKGKEGRRRREGEKLKLHSSHPLLRTLVTSDRGKRGGERSCGGDITYIGNYDRGWRRPTSQLGTQGLRGWKRVAAGTGEGAGVCQTTQAEGGTPQSSVESPSQPSTQESASAARPGRVGRWDCGIEGKVQSAGRVGMMVERIEEKGTKEKERERGGGGGGRGNSKE